MRIKICGITQESELPMLEQNKVDYAGFVIFPPSKRYVSVERAVELKKQLNPKIRTVAVTVAPDRELIDQIVEAGFDIIQIHKDLDMEKIEKISIPVWLALQITEETLTLPALSDNIRAILLDAPEYGSGKTFDWEHFPFAVRRQWQDRELVLAGGLNADNVGRGMELFHPGIVDVSSSVEGEQGKDPEKIRKFVGKVREYE